ncbi:MAG: hypothetical protein PHR40_07050, partial [Bacteroidales bacterium]|nr:hypothetical protein [Bacteroidales bacterium]
MTILIKNIAVIFLLLYSLVGNAQTNKKEEFRGAWIHTVGNQQFKTMSTKEVKELLLETLDALEEAGINAVIFQVRPQADAF